MKIAIAIAIAIHVSMLVSLFPCSHGQQQAAGGRWKILRRNLGISAMHMQLLPNDKIIAFDRTDAGPSNISLPMGRCLNYSKGRDCSAHSVEFSLADHSVRPLTVLTDTWCSSGALSPNGTLIQTGGYTTGDKTVRYFTPCEDKNCDWAEDSHGLAVRRWYSTNHILPDGRVIVVGGRGQASYEFVPKSSNWEYSHPYSLPFLRETTDKWENNLYPFVHLSTDGNLFLFANTKAILLDYVNDRVVRCFPDMTVSISRNYPSSGSSVLLPIVLKSNNDSSVKAEVMICGGAEPDSYSKAKNGTFMPASNTCGRLVITDESPRWEMEEMPMGRVMGDMILLPTGDVLIVNGAAKGTAGWGYARDPVMNPVLYKTGVFDSNESRAFEAMNPSLIPRVYHSTAHLASDGRVLVGGSNTNQRYQFSGVMFPTDLSMEAFFPPYFGSNRPKIVSLGPGEEVEYGVRLSIGVVIGGSMSADVLMEGAVVVTMVAPSFTTHSFSMNQRLLVLAVKGLRHVRGEWYEVDVCAPATAVLAPPGYYMLFVVHRGVPSRGKWIHIGQW